MNIRAPPTSLSETLDNTASSCSNSDIQHSAQIMAAMMQSHASESDGGGGSSDEDSENSIHEQPKRKRPAQNSDKSLKEKNKEHARNTRLRKKNFIDHLKQAIQDLGRERDEDELRLRSELTRIASEVTLTHLVFLHLILCRWRPRNK